MRFENRKQQVIMWRNESKKWEKVKRDEMEWNVKIEINSWGFFSLSVASRKLNKST